MTKYTKLTRAQVIEAHKIMLEVIKPLEEGFCTYVEDESDASIAERLNVSPASISKLRLDLFGKVRSTSQGKVNFDKLQEDYSLLKDRFNKLCDTLAVNRVVNVNHLKLNGGDK